MHPPVEPAVVDEGVGERVGVKRLGGASVEGGWCGEGEGGGVKMETHSKPMISVCTFLCSSMTRLCEGAAGSSSSGLGFFLLLPRPSDPRMRPKMPSRSLSRESSLRKEGVEKLPPETVAARGSMRPLTPSVPLLASSGRLDEPRFVRKLLPKDVLVRLEERLSVRLESSSAVSAR